LRFLPGRIVSGAHHLNWLVLFRLTSCFPCDYTLTDFVKVNGGNSLHDSFCCVFFRKFGKSVPLIALYVIDWFHRTDASCATSDCATLLALVVSLFCGTSATCFAAAVASVKVYRRAWLVCPIQRHSRAGTLA
jgi:hypothetical protein